MSDVERNPDKANFVAPFMIFFAFGLVVAGVCAFVNVVVVNALVRRRMAYMPRPQKVKIKKGKKSKKGKKKSKRSGGESKTSQASTLKSSLKSSPKSKSGSKKSQLSKSKSGSKISQKSKSKTKEETNTADLY